jgi:ParB family chromosome partitioning protein
MKRRALGKGLGALLPEGSGLASMLTLEIEKIKPNPLQPRVAFDAEKLEELAASIRQSGVIQPIVVRPVVEGYEIIAGERRWRAAQQADLKVISAIVQDVSDREMLELALVENVQRDDLSPIEEALAYRLMVEQFELSQAEIAKRVGRSRTAVTNTLRLLQLPLAVQQMVITGALSMGHARALIPLPEKEQLKLAALIAAQGLSVRDVERRVQRILNPPVPKRPRSKDPNVLRAEQRLEDVWQTKVQIRQRGQKGQILFHFHSEDELQRLFEGLTKR